MSWRIGLTLGAALLLAGCDALIAVVPDNLRQPPPAGAFAGVARTVVGGDPAMGRALVEGGQHGCHGCHTITGIRKARGVVGPPLHRYGERSFIAGRFPNTPQVLVSYLVDPPAWDEGTGMPKLGLTADEARHIAAFLYAGTGERDGF